MLPERYAPLLIRRVDAICVRLPLFKPVLMAGVDVRHSDNMLVRIEASSGMTGWGEAPAAPSHGGETLASMAHTVTRVVQPYLVGKDALGLSGHTSQLAQIHGKADSALAAVDLALHDLAGKHLGLPAHVLLGGLRRVRIAPLWLVGTASSADDLREAELRYEEGYRYFKLKLGVKSLAEDIESTNVLRARFGDSIRLCADANEGFSLEGACTYVRAVSSSGVEFLEQPLAKDDLDGLRQLCSMSPVPIGLDEAVVGAGDLLGVSRTGVRGVALKTIKMGGMSGVVAASHLCTALGLKVNLSGKIAETSIGSAGLLQLGAVLPSVEWGVSPTHLYLHEDVVDAPLRPRQGHYDVPMRPGLGVEVDEGRVARLAISPTANVESV